MKPAIDITIGELALLGWPLERTELDVQRLLHAALQRVAERLAGSPLARAGVGELALERLELGTIPADELLGPRGAERLADELYSSMTRAMALAPSRSTR